MKLRKQNLTSLFKHLPVYDGHLVKGLVDESDKIITATFIHREGMGMHSIYGPLIKSGGGWRRPLQLYANDYAAATNGLCMSSAMSNKFAGLGLPIGGAKTITFVHNMPSILTEPVFQEVMKIFGAEVLADIGSYLTAEDSNTKRHHMAFLKDYAPRGLVAGFERDVSEVTADGVIIGIETVATIAFPGAPAGLHELSYAFRGVGSVGAYIVNKLWDRGARRMVISDSVEGLAEKVRAGRDIGIVSPDSIYDESADVFVPCALGGSITAEAIERMTFYIIAGPENNQLTTPEVGKSLYENGIDYVTDYIINAGGLMAVVADAITGKPVEEMFPLIAKNIIRIFKISKETKTAPSIVADNMVRERVAKLSLPH